MTRPSLEEVVHSVRVFPGTTRKQAIGTVVARLGATTTSERIAVGPGDDAAAVEFGDGYLLLAAEGIWSGLLERDLYLAGRSAVIANVNDIYAMGGTPLAMVNVVAGERISTRPELFKGVADECSRLDVPMVGGHINPDGAGESLAAAILGSASCLVRASAARPGDRIVLAIDKRGRRWGDWILNWDSHEGKASGELLADLAVITSIAGSGHCSAMRDVSNAGILGSIGTMLELSGTGAVVDLDGIDPPQGLSLLDWLRCYPSYGFCLAVTPAHAGWCIERFHDRGIWSLAVGEIVEGRDFILRYGGRTAPLFDFRREGITGLSPQRVGQGDTS